MSIGSHYLHGEKTKFTVWAPLKNNMILHIVHPSEQKIQMQKDEWGYFHAEAKADAGCRYFFRPEDETDYPDPASKFQPLGVHGPSEVIDDFFAWSDRDWKAIPFNELILYELHIGSFTKDGTFEAAIDKLDHLKNTGINAIEIMPVAQFPGNRNWGYDGAFSYAVQNSYGGPLAFKKLVNECHKKGIAVFLDVVYNHLGPEGNYLEMFGPYFTDHYKTPWGKAINFDGEYSDGVREYFSENALYWFEYFHLDGLRFDAIHGVYDMGAFHFWQMMHTKIRQLEERTGRTFYTIAESDYNDPKVIRAIETGGYGFTAQWMDDFHHALYTLTDIEEGKKLYADFGKITQLAKAFKDGFVHSGEYVGFRKRKFGSSSAGISGNNFVVFTDNHDQAGNRVTGGRLTSLINFEKIKLSSAACMLAPYIPLLFMGEEYGEEAPFFYFVNHGDEKLIELVREGRKKEFEHHGWKEDPPDPFDEKTFLHTKLQWNKVNEGRYEIIHRWYKQLIQFRRTHKAFQSFDKDDIWVNVIGNMLHVCRRSACQKFECNLLFNFSEEASLPFTSPGSPGWKKILDSNDDQWLVDKAHHEPVSGTLEEGEKIVIPRLTVLVYENTH
jgi:maltooligosyltrehalose trehalohydrolase